MKQSNTPPRAQRSLIIVGAVVLACFALSEFATEAWYRYKEGQAAKTEPWNIQFPNPEDTETAQKKGFFSFTTSELGDREKEILHVETGLSASWRDARGNAWNAFSLSWPPDKRLGEIDSAHNPTICLPAAGIELVEPGPVVNMQIGDTEMPFQTWIFKQGSQEIYVFMGVRREFNVGELFLVTDTSREGKLSRAIGKASTGVRGGPLQALQLYVVGPRSLEEATELAKRQILNFQG
jgi:hypothetical protein